MKTLILFIEEFQTEFEALLAISQQENAYFRNWILKTTEFNTITVHEKIID